MFRVSHCVDNSSLNGGTINSYHCAQISGRRFGVLDSAPVVLFSWQIRRQKEAATVVGGLSAGTTRSQMPPSTRWGWPSSVANRARSSAEAIPDVHFAGFLNQTEMPTAYTAADILVLPSAYEETWGLVVNEAMNCGLPVIVSDRVGCAADLVHDGENGFVFQSGDADGLAVAIRKLVTSDQMRAVFGRRSANLIESFGISTVSDQLVNACLAVTGQNESRFGSRTMTETDACEMTTLRK